MLATLVSSAALFSACLRPVRPPAVTPHTERGSVEPGGDRRDFAAIREFVGSAHVVALGEPAHGVHEPLALRNRLFEYLVEELGFTAIALEAPFPESRKLSEYVAGGPGTAESVLAEFRGWSAQPIEENLQLVRWMRAWNTTPGRQRPIRLYAIDLSYTGPWGSRPTPAALEAALAYVRRVDPASARRLDAAITPWLRRMEDPSLPMKRPEHDVLTAAIDDLLSLLERERVTYLAAAPEADYEWAHRAATIAMQADRMFRVVPDEPPGDRVPPGAWRAINARDAAMAANVLWALRQQEQGGRLLLVAHNVHVQGAKRPGGPWDVLERMPTAMGEHLRAALGPSLVSIAVSDVASASRYIGLVAPDRVAPVPFFQDLRSTWAGFDGLMVVDSLTPARPVRARP